MSSDSPPYEILMSPFNSEPAGIFPEVWIIWGKSRWRSGREVWVYTMEMQHFMETACWWNSKPNNRKKSQNFPFSKSLDCFGSWLLEGNISLKISIRKGPLGSQPLAALWAVSGLQETLKSGGQRYCQKLLRNKSTVFEKYSKRRSDPDLLWRMWARNAARIAYFSS